MTRQQRADGHETGDVTSQRYEDGLELLRRDVAMLAGVQIPNGDAELLKPSVRRKPFGPRIILPNTTPDQDARFSAILSNARWNGAGPDYTLPEELPQYRTQFSNNIGYSFPQFTPDPKGKVALRNDKANALRKRDALKAKVSAANTRYLELKRSIQCSAENEDDYLAQLATHETEYLRFMADVDEAYDDLYRVAPSISNQKQQASLNFCSDFYSLDAAVIRYTLESMIALCGENSWFREPTAALFSNLRANQHLVDTHNIRYRLECEFDQTDAPIGSGKTSPREEWRDALICKWFYLLRDLGLDGCRSESSAADTVNTAPSAIMQIWVEERMYDREPLTEGIIRGIVYRPIVDAPPQ